MSDIDSFAKDFLNNVTNATSMVAYITENTDKLNPVDTVMFSMALIEFGEKIAPIYRDLKRRNGETSTTVIKFEK